MVKWVDESYEYKGYKIGQNIIYKLSNSDDECLEGEIIGFNLSDDAIFPVYIQPKRYGVSLKERISFMERNNCILYNGVDIDSCMFNNITFENIKTKIMDGDDMFKNAKIGDRVWHICKGWAVIYFINKSSILPIKVEFNDGTTKSFTVDGKEYNSDINPTLFWDEIKYSIPEKPFKLSDELKKLEIKEFRRGYHNYYISYDLKYNEVTFQYNKKLKIPNVLYFSIQSIEKFIESIDNIKISKEEFYKAYNDVFGGR